MNASATQSSVSPGISHAERLGRIAAFVLATMPLGMAIAHRSAPLFLGISTVLLVAAVIADGDLVRLLREARAALTTPVGLAAAAFFGWSLVSIGWSEVRGASWRAFGEFWPTIAAAFVLSLALPARAPRRSLWILAGAIALACTSMLLELRLGLSVRKWLGVRAWQFIFNRPALTVMVTIVPVLVWLTGTAGRRHRPLAAALAALAALLITVSWSGAASLGLALMVLVLPLAWFWPRMALWISAAALVAGFAIAPFQGAIANSLIPPKLTAELADTHSRERIDVWLSFGAAIREDPILGAGFGASARLQDTSVAARVPPERRALLEVGHPHDAAMQIWTELGIVGAALATLLLLLLLWSMRAWPARKLAPALALLAGVASVALVGHGAWQGWWAASVGAAIVWLRVAERAQLETSWRETS
jgi:O-antigen ligase